MPVLYTVVALLVVGLIAWLVNTRAGMLPGVRTVVNLVLGLIVVGVALLLINSYIPMAGSIKAILNIVVVVATCVGVLQAVGLWSEVVRLWNNLTHRRLVH